MKNCIFSNLKHIAFMNILQMASFSHNRGGQGGRGNSPRGRGPGGRILSSQISIDNESFTMVAKNKKGGNIGSFSSFSQKVK